MTSQALAELASQIVWLCSHVRGVHSRDKGACEDCLVNALASLVLLFQSDLDTVVNEMDSLERETEARVWEEAAKWWDDTEARSAEAHAVYQQEAHRRGDVRHHDDYAALPEATKEWDRVLVRWIAASLRARAADGEQYTSRCGNYAEYDPPGCQKPKGHDGNCGSAGFGRAPAAKRREETA